MRHTAATYAMDHGANTKEIAQMLGHKSTKHTERYAKRLGMERKRQTAAIMERRVSRKDQVTSNSGCLTASHYRPIEPPTAIEPPTGTNPGPPPAPAPPNGREVPANDSPRMASSSVTVICACARFQ
jgi:hypothetical protein